MTRLLRLALLTLAVGFLVEAGTEAYQFFTLGYLHRAWVGFYYVGLVTTGLGFYLIFRGRQEWTELHRRSVLHGHRHLWVAVGLYAGATVAIVILGTLDGAPSSGAPPLAVVALVGGLVALAFGNFFLSLVLIVLRLLSPLGRVLAWTAFGWSLGVAVLTGVIVGQAFPTLLHEFFAAPLSLVVSFAPLAFAMAPLFVTYFLLALAYGDAYLGVLEGPGPAQRVPISSGAEPRSKPSVP